MANEDIHLLLLARARRALGTNTPSEAGRKVRAIIGTRNIPNSEVEAQHAIEALQNGHTPTAQQLQALEIVIRLLRPVVMSRDGLLDDLPETEKKDLQPAALKDAWSAFRTKVRPYVGSIGRIEDSNNRHVGTGFVVGEGLIATNRHVLAVLTNGSEALSPNSARIVFKQEAGSQNTASDMVSISDVAKIHRKKDIAILRAAIGGRAAVRFAESTPATGANIVTIGYPGKDEANNPLFLSSIFNGNFGVKSAALGELLDGTEGSDIFHDCSTTQGNSGSPVFDLSTGEVAGIHKSGYFMYRNEAVGSQEIRALI